MADVQVTCINKQSRHSTHEGITHLGGPGWTLPLQVVITLIRKQPNLFYTYVGSNKAYLKVVKGHHGDYVQTHADGKPNDNLLALPECSLAHRSSVITSA